MSFSSTNVNRETDAIDYLNWLKIYAQSNQAGGTGGVNFTPLYIIGLQNDFSVTDTISVNGTTKNLSNNFTSTDTITETDYPAGASNLAGNAFKKLWLQFNNDVLDNSTNGNDGTITYHSSLKALYAFSDYGSLNDATSGAHNLTLGAGTTAFKRGKEGTGLSFDGSTYYTANSAVIITGSSDRTVSLQVKTPGNINSVGNNYLFSWGTWGSNHNFFGLTTVVSGSGKVFYLQGWNDDLQCSTILKPNTWYHVVCVVSSTGTILTVYLNGVLEATSSGHAINTTSSSLFVGAASNGTGIIDSGFIVNQFRIYSIAASLAQVQALYMSGVIGSCHTFDGGEYVTCPSGSVVTGSTDRTVSLWYYPTSFVDGLRLIEYGVNSGRTLFSIRLSGTSGLLELFDGTSGYASTGSVTLNTWNHVVFTISTTGTILKIYINGVLDSTTTITAINSSSSSLFVGASLTATSPLLGQVDDLQVWNNYVLSQAEINYLYAKKDGWQVEDDADYQNLWLSFDNDYVDKSGNNNAGTLTGTETYVAGPKKTKAFSFNGSSYINTINTSGFERTQPFSFAFWYKGVNTGGGNEVIISKETTFLTTIGLSLIVNGSSLLISLLNTALTNEIRVKSSIMINDGNWHHCVCTYDGSSLAGGVKFYIDGIVDSAPSIQFNNLNATINNTIPFTIGAGNDGGSKLVSGEILSDVQIWNYILSQADINTLLGGQQIAHNPVVPTPAKSDFMEAVA